MSKIPEFPRPGVDKGAHEHEYTQGIGITSDAREFQTRTLPVLLDRTSGISDLTSEEGKLASRLVMDRVESHYGEFLTSLRSMFERRYGHTTTLDLPKEEVSSATNVIMTEACDALGTPQDKVGVAVIDYLYMDQWPTQVRWVPFDINRMYGQANGLSPVGYGPRPNLKEQKGYSTLAEQAQSIAKTFQDEKKEKLLVFDNSLDTGNSMKLCLDELKKAGWPADGLVLIYGLLPRAARLREQGGPLEHMFIYSSQDSKNPKAKPLPQTKVEMIGGYMGTDSIIGCPASVVGEPTPSGEHRPLIRFTKDNLPVGFTHTYGLDAQSDQPSGNHIYQGFTPDGLEDLERITLEANCNLWDDLGTMMRQKIRWSDIGLLPISIVDPNNPDQFDKPIVDDLKERLGR